jgi:peptidyl-prolyl cis-trans isomerase C
MTLAAELIAILQADIGRFDELAQRFSACPSRERGGRLGPVSRGDTVPEFETFLFSLAQGELCPLPIQTRYGVHVMRLDSRASAEPVSYDLVRDRIAEFLRARSLHTALRQYITILAGRTNIEGLGISAAHSPLVQ